MSVSVHKTSSWGGGGGDRERDRKKRREGGEKREEREEILCVSPQELQVHETSAWPPRTTWLMVISLSKSVNLAP